MWQWIGNILFILYLFLILKENSDRKKQIECLTKKCINLEKENEKLKIGRTKYSIGDEIFYLSNEEHQRYEKWYDFYDFDKMKDVDILTSEDDVKIIMHEIFNNLSNQEILENLIKKSKREY